MTSSDRLGDFTADARILVLTAMAGAIGVVSAFVALALLRLIGFFTHLFYFHDFGTSLVSPEGHHLGLWALPIPVVGGLIVGWMARYGSEQIRGHGIPEALEAILIGKSRMSVKVAILKPLSTALSIGTGGPFGAEGPIIMTGGAFGSLFAQAFHLSAAERKTLLVAGAAGGMAAVFDAPVASVLIAVELLLFEWKPRSFIPVSAAAAVAAGLRVPLIGQGPVFPVTLHPTASPAALGMALVVGLVAGFASGGLTWLVYTYEDLFGKLRFHWMWWPALGGIAIGVGGLLYPRALGVGYDTAHDLLAGRLIGAALLGLLITKALIWSISLGSGTSGGVLAPLLIMGGSLGALEASWTHGDPGVAAAISMGAMLGGTMRSPFTATVFMLELTHDVGLLPAMFVGCVAADAVTVLLMKRSILTEKVARHGHHVMREYQVSPVHQRRVEDVMEREVPTVPASLPFDTVFRQIADLDPLLARRHAWLIVDAAGRLAGVITRGDLIRELDHGDGRRSVLDAGTKHPVVTHPDAMLEQAMELMLQHDIGGLPVVSREDPRRLVGYLGRTDILSAWQQAWREDQVREAGWLSEPLRALRRNLESTLGGERPG
ncbi:MAG TPA: chloride channel protein [Gemmatimonadales bacterium]|nr:chloride channel protein [Gemmatimonadales bacterium]